MSLFKNISDCTFSFLVLGTSSYLEMSILPVQAPWTDMKKIMLIGLIS